MENTQNPTALSAAMELFNAGKYDEVLSFASGTTDPALMLLAARSYAALGQRDIAETLLTSLIRILPGSSYLHSYLGDVYLAEHDEQKAEAEYVKALLLDQENPAAVREYANLRLKKGDLRGAIPALRALVREGSKADAAVLIRTLTAVGEPAEAVALHLSHFGEDVITPEFVEALFDAGEYQRALNAALRGWNETKDTVYLRLDLEALSAIDRDAAEKAYRSALDSFEEAEIADENVSSIRFSFVLLEKYLEHFDAAEFEISPLLRPDTDAVYHLLAAELAAKQDDGERASAIYRDLIESLFTGNPEWEIAELVLDHYSTFLSAVRTKEEVAGVLSVVLSKYPSAACLAKIGESYEEAGALHQAKDWFYRAYRADIIHGGLAYAGFLKRTDAVREAETVIRYILTSAESVADIEQSADIILHGDDGLYQLEKTRTLVLKTLGGVADELSSHGREMLAAVYLYSAVDTLECGQYGDCKWFCLAGMDVLPCYPEKISIQDFTDILSRVKGRAIAERPILLEKINEPAVFPGNAEASSFSAEESESADGEEEILPNLDEREKKLLAFLREHGEATEMDLRSVLDTRRVTGIVNTLLEKTAEFGVTLIEKRGIGERGEIYGYILRR